MIARALILLGFEPLIDFRLQDRGGTVELEWLRKDIAVPTQAEIDAADAAAAAEEAQVAQDKATLDTLRTQVRGALTALNTIQNAASFTNAQRDAAIKELAQIVDRLVRVTMEIAR